jgi:hypothetical protein
MVQTKLKRIAFGCFVVGMMISGAANATTIIPPGWSALTIDATINPGYQTIFHIATFVKTTTSSGIGRYSSAVPGLNQWTTPVPPQGGVVLNGFAAGLISGLPSDPVGQAILHLVVFGKFTTAQLQLDYATLFPDISESTIINDLLNTPASSPPLPVADYTAFKTDAFNDGLYGGNNALLDAVAFSTGQLIGSAKVTLTPTPKQLPEPLTISIFGAGIAGAIGLRRRKVTKLR